MSFMPMVGTQVRLTDGRTAWISTASPIHGKNDNVIFEDGHQESVDVMTGIAEIIGEEMPTVVLASLCYEDDDPVVRAQPLSQRTVQAHVVYQEGRPKIHYDPLPEE